MQGSVEAEPWGATPEPSMIPSPTVALRYALFAVLEAGATILAGDKVYMEGSDQLRGADLPYVILGTGTETRDGVSRYNAIHRHENTAQVRCWGHDKDEAERVYVEVKGKLDEMPLVITGHGTAYGRVSKVTDFAEPNPEVGGHVVVALYRVISQVAA